MFLLPLFSISLTSFHLHLTRPPSFLDDLFLSPSLSPSDLLTYITAQLLLVHGPTINSGFTASSSPPLHHVLLPLPPLVLIVCFNGHQELVGYFQSIYM